MIRRFQALGYRCLRYCDIELDRFHLVVGANASGKSTFFDALAFLRDLVVSGLEGAVESRTRNFQDLAWGRPRESSGFELAVEFDVPDAVGKLLPAERRFRRFRYEVAIRERDDRRLLIEAERGLLIPERPAIVRRPLLFPEPPEPPKTILTGPGRRGNRSVLSKSGARGTFAFETSDRAGKGWVTNIFLGDSSSAFGSLPDLSKDFPMATWVRRQLRRLQVVFPVSAAIRRPSPPHRRGRRLEGDASNLPWIVGWFRDEHPAAYREWLEHLRTVLPEVSEVAAVERPEDRYAYLELDYASGLRAPSWIVSDGTLRLLALTLPAYLPEHREIHCFDEPENGVHPTALDAVYDSLASVYESQVLAATHSPVLLRRARPEEVLCFAANDHGATDIVPGDRHPLLRKWGRDVDTEMLFATGVIG